MSTADKAVAPKKKTPIGVHLLAGGAAGMSEALVCRESPVLLLAVLTRSQTRSTRSRSACS